MKVMLLAILLSNMYYFFQTVFEINELTEKTGASTMTNFSSAWSDTY